MPPIQLQFIGSPSLQAEGSPRAHLAPGDAVLLLQLAVQGPQPRRAIAALLWPDADPAGAANNLRQRLFRLKALAGGDVATGRTVLVLSPAVRHDLDGYFERLQADAGHAPGELLAGAEFSTDGELMAWLTAERDRFAARKAAVLAAAIDGRVAQGEWDQALAFAERWVADLPSSEQAHRRLMELHHLQGDAAAALAAYARCVQWLAQSHGGAVSASTRALAEAIRAGQSAVPVRPDAARGQGVPVVLRRPPLLVEREAVSQAVQAALGGPLPVLVEGEAGVGKTRLCQTLLADWHRPQALPLSSPLTPPPAAPMTSSGAAGLAPGTDANPTPQWCGIDMAEGDAAIPLITISRLLAAAARAWGAPPDSDATRDLAHLAPGLGAPSARPPELARLTQALGELLRHWQDRGLRGVWIDDLHFADATSLTVLATVMPDALKAGVQWLLAARPASLPDAWRDACQVVPVPALTLAGTQTLIDSLHLPQFDSARWAAPLQQRTGGNPLYLLQLLCAAAEQAVDAPDERRGQPTPPAAPAAAAADPLQALATPASLKALVARRLQRLSAPARDLVRLAAVAGEQFSLPLAARLLARATVELAEPWQELQNAQVLGDEGFAHDLIAEAARAWVPAPIARQLHADVAQVLTDQPGQAARAAAHWVSAGRWAEAADDYARAADQARALDAQSDELDKLQRAIHALDQLDDPAARPRAFQLRHRALRLRVVNTQLGDTTLADGQALVAEARGVRESAMAWELLAYFHAQRVESDEGLRAATRAMALADEAGDPVTRCRAAQHGAGALTRLGRPGEAIAQLQAVQADLHHLPPADQLMWQADLALALDYADRRQESVQVLQPLAQQARAEGHWVVAATACGLLCNALMYLGRTAESLQAAEQSLACSRRAAVPPEGLLVDEGNLAGLLRDLGRFDEFLALAEPLTERLRAAGNGFWALLFEHDLAVAYAWMGRPDLALQRLSLDHPDHTDLTLAMRLNTRARLARDYDLPGGVGSARRWMAQALQHLDRAGVQGRSYVRLSLRLTAARGEAPAEALHLIGPIRHEAHQRQNHMLAGLADLLLLRTHLALADSPAATRLARQLLAQVDTQGPLANAYMPELWHLAVTALQHTDPETAEQCVRRAVGWIAQAARRVPPLHRSSFLSRNPYNAALLRQAEAIR